MIRASASSISFFILSLSWWGCDSSVPGAGSAAPERATPVSTVAAVEKPAERETAPAEPTAPAVETPVDPYGPLSAAQRQILTSGAEDGGVPLEDHYVQSNERRHDTWFPYIAGLGGAFIGVGPDQCYTVAAAQGAELIFILDIDHMVVDLHLNYEILIKASDTPEQLVARFDEANRDATVALLEAAYADREESDRRRKLQTYKTSRETVFRHLGRVIKRHEGDVATSWLANPDYYAHIRKLYDSGRVRIMDGDLTGAETMKSIGVATTQLGIPVRVLYLSNAEEYFAYSRQYAANVAGLPRDERSLALRTIYNKEWQHADSLWNYQVQPLEDYQARLQDASLRKRNYMIRAAEKDGKLERTTSVKGLSRIAVPAPASE